MLAFGALLLSAACSGTATILQAGVARRLPTADRLDAGLLLRLLRRSAYLAALGLLVLFAGEMSAVPKAFGVNPLWLTGGLMGALLITVSLVTVRTLGAGGVVAATLCGQLVISAVLDRAGVLGLEATALTPERLLGFVLLIVGTLLDATFGPMIMVGLGGVTTELFRDVVYRPAPVSAVEAAAMLAELKAAPLLNGFRGAAKADVAALSQLIAQVSMLAARQRAEISEIELNPVLVHAEGQGATIVDALVVPKN